MFRHTDAKPNDNPLDSFYDYLHNTYYDVNERAFFHSDERTKGPSELTKSTNTLVKL